MTVPDWGGIQPLRAVRDDLHRDATCGRRETGAMPEQGDRGGARDGNGVEESRGAVPR